jgi:hypothetical protein
MALIYEVPTHLNVEDTLIFGLTPRQLLRISVGASLAYAVWDQTSFLADGIRSGPVVVLALLGLLVGLVQPSGRPLDQWFLAAVHFLLGPRRRVWRLRDPSSRGELNNSASDWAELSPVPAWLGPCEANRRVLKAARHEDHWREWRRQR